MERHKLKCQILGTQRTQCMQNVFLSVSLERKFLVEVQRRQFSAVQRQTAKITRRNNTTMENAKSSTRGFLRKCQPPARQRFPGGSERQEREGRNARPKRLERSRTTSQMQPSAQERRNSAVLHTMWRQKAMVPKEVRVHCSVVRLAKRCEGLGVQSLADLTNLPLTGCGAFVLDGTKRFHDKSRGRTVLRDAQRVGPPELRRNNGKCEHV